VRHWAGPRPSGGRFPPGLSRPQAPFSRHPGRSAAESRDPSGLRRRPWLVASADAVWIPDQVRDDGFLHLSSWPQPLSRHPGRSEAESRDPWGLCRRPGLVASAAAAWIPDQVRDDGLSTRRGTTRVMLARYADWRSWNRTRSGNSTIWISPTSTRCWTRRPDSRSDACGVDAVSGRGGLQSVSLSVPEAY
jgi:hypothetical protein